MEGGDVACRFWCHCYSPASQKRRLRMWGAFIFAVLAGASFVVQQAVNASLRAQIGYPFSAGFVSYLGGTIAMLLMVVIMREPWLTLDVAARTSALSWSGGIFGAIYIAISILLL